MSISVTQRPSTTISGETSRWNGAKSPIVYKFTTTSYAQPNYRLDVYVFNSANTQLNTDPLSFTPNSSGNIVADIQVVLKNNLSPDFTGDLSNNTKIHTDTNWVKFYIKYQEVWDSSVESLINDSSNQFFAIYGALKIPSTYGGNFAEYVSFDDGDPKCKFLTRMDEVNMWKGFPCLLSVIVGDGVSGNTFIHADGFDSTPTNYSGKIITVDLNELVTTQADDFSVKLYKDNTPDDLLSETKQVRLLDACSNSVCLIGRNKIGGMISWVFDVDQDYTYDNGAPRKLLKASNLTLSQWEALNDFFSGQIYKTSIPEFTSSINKTSSQIGNQVYVVEDGIKTGVTVVSKPNTTRTRQVKHNFEIEIEYPEEW